MRSLRSIWDSRVKPEGSWVPRWTAAPIIVAEALVGVSDPLLTALQQPGRAGAPVAVAAAIARSLGPPEDSDFPPEWLPKQQIPSFRRVLSAIRRYHGALLADP